MHIIFFGKDSQWKILFFGKSFPFFSDGKYAHPDILYVANERKRMQILRFAILFGKDDLLHTVKLQKIKIPPENRRDLKYSHEKQTSDKDNVLYQLFCLFFVTFVEFINTSCSIYQYIFTSVKRMRSI